MFPLYEMLVAHAQKQGTSFHMPGHKAGRGLGDFSPHDLLALDTTELHDTDNLHAPTGAIKQAQELAAKAFGARHTFFLTGGSTAGILAMLAAVTKPNDRFIVDRNCHSAVINALILSRVQPIFVYPPLVNDLVGGVTVDGVAQALRENPDVVGVFLTSPTYYGLSADIKGIADIVHQAGKILLVDEAHGAHFAFHDDLPMTALSAGADMCVQSAHKTLPALTQSAYLHIGSDKIDKQQVQTMLQMFQSSSPSFLLMAYLDVARHILSTTGQQKLTYLLQRLKQLRAVLPCVDEHLLGQAGISQMDWTRLVLDLDGLPTTGVEVAEILSKKHNIQVEMADRRYVMLITTIDNTDADFDKLLHAMQALASHQPQKKACKVSQLPQATLLMSPSDAFHAKTREMSMHEAVGQIAARTVSCFPPCVPVLCPGECITAQAVAYLQQMQTSGSSILGLSAQEQLVVVAPL
ncbi:MAG: aminotransferase class I/II-fold pyridoxal phosphate-dependent enzyme [Hyphomonadaceae bacterium]|nr:aminotransferase class I/II-fold pyridoxal phosphate-dependent enzyme [Clostridia bacterium]